MISIERNPELGFYMLRIDYFKILVTSYDLTLLADCLKELGFL